MAEPVRVYVDTSVIGGTQDEEFQEPSQRFLDQARQGKFILLVSALTLRELVEAPEAVRRALTDLPRSCIEEVAPDAERAGAQLAQAYLFAGVLGPARLDDATHVGIATAAGADLILSWNFQHIVNVARIARFNRVNVGRGYREIDIRSPLEVIYGDESQDA